VRIISATNRRLEQLVAKRQFREDLYYRLNVFRIELPEIKARREDLPLLISHILRRLSATRVNRRLALSEEALETLLNYDYPGNVRELENILEHALIICTDEIIRRKHLPDYLHNRIEQAQIEAALGTISAPVVENNDRQKIIAALQKHNGNRGQTARFLGIDRTTLWRRMKRLGIRM
jgi:transcriptional regulator with PAS, ATPase and Fis domain